MLPVLRAGFRTALPRSPPLPRAVYHGAAGPPRRALAGLGPGAANAPTAAAATAAVDAWRAPMTTPSSLQAGRADAAAPTSLADPAGGPAAARALSTLPFPVPLPGPTAALPAMEQPQPVQQPRQRQRGDALDFDDVQVSFATKSTAELVRAYAVFQLSAINPLVRYSRQLLDLSYAVAGKAVTEWLLRQTFFGHFCAGEDADDIVPTVRRLEAAGIGAILDYAAEADVGDAAQAAATAAGAAADAQERRYDGNLELLLSCVATSARSRIGGFAACKLTALTDPALLERVSTVLTQRGVARGDAAAVTPAELAADPALTPAERAQLARLVARLERLGAAALEQRVRLLVDAEYTYLQPAIDYCAAHLQRRYNRAFPTIFQTYQCYLLDSLDRVRADLDRARAGGYHFAAKIVRGAYLVQERALAAQQGRPDPIHATIEATHASYNAAVRAAILAEQPREVMVASHNEESARRAVAAMDERGLAPTPASGVYFGQLLGMCDHVTYALAQRGYPVYKYVPYGPIHEVLPYLIRRAQENASVMAGAAKERQLLRRELARRLRTSPPLKALTA